MPTTFQDEARRIITDLHVEIGVEAEDAKRRAAELLTNLTALASEPDESVRRQGVASIYGAALLAKEVVAIKGRKATNKAFQRALLATLDVALAAIVKIPVPASAVRA
jgi:hypothetical protein